MPKNRLDFRVDWKYHGWTGGVGTGGTNKPTKVSVCVNQQLKRQKWTSGTISF